MLTKFQKVFSILTATTWIVSGCALSTTNSTSPQTTLPTAVTSPLETTGGATSAQTTAAGKTTPATKPATSATSTTTADTQAPVTTPAQTTPSTTAVQTTPTTTTAPATKPAVIKNPIDPADIKTGNAYDTATVRDWMWNNEAADYYPKQNLVFLTFDDGPSTDNTPKILDILEKNKVNGTFFYYTNGNLANRAAIIRRTVENGNAIAIHTNTHDYGLLYPKRQSDVAAIVKDAQTAITKIKGILGEDWTTGVYRFPGGSFSWTGTKAARAEMKKAKTALADIGLAYLDWNAMTGDADLENKDKSPEGLVKFAIKTTKNATGHVIVLLMHDAGHPNGPKALQGVIDYYKAAGYEFGILK